MSTLGVGWVCIENENTYHAEMLTVINGMWQGKQLSQLLDEDPALMERRLQCAKRLELYKSARDEIDSVSWAR